MASKVSFPFARSFAAVMQPVVAFIIHIVWQNCSIRGIKLLLKSLRKEFLQGNFLHAPLINAVFVNKEKTRKLRSCSLLCVDVAPHHTTGNVYQGTMRFIIYILTAFYWIVPFLTFYLVSFCNYQRDRI